MDNVMAFFQRCLFFLEAKHELTLVVQHVPVMENSVADAISRNKFDMLFSLYPQVSWKAVEVDARVTRRSVIGRQTLGRGGWRSCRVIHCSINETTNLFIRTEVLTIVGSAP